VWARIRKGVPPGLNLVGEAEIEFDLDQEGRLKSTRLARSSGDRQLDQLALRTVRLVAPFPKPSGRLDCNRLNFILPVQFH
jgi:protein TonB